MARVLFLSPMESMSAHAPAVADELGIDLVVETASDAEAFAAVRRHPDIEVVVTRGGLADLIRQIPGISVVEIAMSLNELLGQLSCLTRTGLKRIAMVSRANLFSGAVGDFEILGAHVSIHPESDSSAIRDRVRQMVESGYDAIIGCKVAYITACELGVRAVVLESGPIPIRAAFCEAQRILEAKREEKLKSAQMAAIMENIDEAVIAVTPEHEVSFFNRNARRLFPVNAAGTPDFSRALAVMSSGDKEQLTTINGNRVVARSIPLEFDQRVHGQVLTLQEVTRIQASESKIRSTLHEKGLAARYRFDDLIGSSDAIQQLILRAKVYAGHDANLMIYGETGTGKEIFAQSVHNHSRRKSAPFVSVNVASIPPSLLESELFGYVDGAFTGARKGGKPGLFELAHGGTLFLDEIGELAPEIQSRLLRVLQEREIMRLGDDKIIPVDVRIISATNRDLFQQTQNGSFRQDLYYRIHVFSLKIPPLRERVDDISPIFRHYLRGFSVQSGRQSKLSRAAEHYMRGYVWPGNIRQLRNVAEVLAYSESVSIDTPELREAIGNPEPAPALVAGKNDGFPERASLKEIEATVIRSLMARYSTAEVCSRLCISRATLWRKLQHLPVPCS